jgi:hypothetical protein
MPATGREIVYQDESGVVYWDAGTQCIEIEVRRYIPGAAFKATLESLFQVIKTKNARKLLADLSRMDKISVEDMTWTETDWLPRSVKAGVVVFATILPKSLSAHMTVDKMSENLVPASAEYVRRMFKDVNEAREWVRQQK